MIKLFQHLLPRGRAWSTIVNKPLRQFIDGLSAFVPAQRLFMDLIWFDILPSTTREVDQWEQQFGLVYNSDLTDGERRAAIDASWKAVGGQSPRYIQDTLQNAGFNVFIHEWWEPVFPPPVARVPDVNCVMLVNKFVYENVTFPATQCGEPLAQCGELNAECGGLPGLDIFDKVYPVPTDPADFPYVLYIGAEIYPNDADVPLVRRLEFESLCLKICPTQQWLCMHINYV